MLASEHVVFLSRLQFGLTASIHFLFVPLTLGLSWLLVIMETTYLITNKPIYKHMTQFWGKLFGINFAMAVITGLTLEFQFGQNWSFFSQYIGDVFGVPLAVEGLTAFMLESALIGVFFFGWNKVSRVQHWIATVCLAIGSSLSGLVILVANGWMQHPVGAYFNYKTMRMELSSWSQLWLNSDAQVRFVHTVAAGYVTASMFVLGLSAYYILKKRDLPFAKRSFAIAAGFGLASVLSVIVLGDANGVEVERLQPPKMAAIEAIWSTAKPPAAWTAFAWPDAKTQTNKFAIDIPWALSIIATHSLSKPIVGIKQIIQRNKLRIRQGVMAYNALQRIHKGDKNSQTFMTFQRYKKYLGYGLLLKPYAKNMQQPTIAEINQAAQHSVPEVFGLFWCFRVMVAIGLFMLALFIAAVYFSAKKTMWHKDWLLKTMFYSIPLPWIAVTCGWFIAENGRQPWTVFGILPTAISSSLLKPHDIITSLCAFILLFGGLFVVELILMTKYARLGPSCLHTGNYHFEKLKQQEA